MRNRPYGFEIYLVNVKIAQNFVAFSEYMNFNLALLLSIIPRYLEIQRNFNVSPVGFKHLSLGTMKNKKRRQAINNFYTFSNMFGYYGTL